MASSRIESYSSYIQFQAPNKERISSVLFASLAASLATVNFGYALGYSAQAQLSEDFHHLDKVEDFSIFASVVALGALFGGMLAGYLIDKIGRKSTILLTSIFYVIGWLMIICSLYIRRKNCKKCWKNLGQEILWLLNGGRAISGIGVGMSSLAVPVYISEVASARTRGAFGNINQLSINFGFLIAFYVGLESLHPDFKVQKECQGPKSSYPVMVPIIICTLNVLLMVFMHETPRWLLKNNKRHKAIKSLSWLRGYNYHVEQECFEIECSLGFGDDDERQEKWTTADLKKPTFYRPLAIALLLMFFQEFTGINSVLFYCTQIFFEAGIGRSNDNVVNIVNIVNNVETFSLYIGITLFAFTVISIFLVDRIGRRILFITGSAVMTITLSLIGLYFFFNRLPRKITTTNNTSSRSIEERYSQLAAAATFIYIAFFSIGWGPLPWLLMSEFFPIKTRGFATSIVTCANWLFVFISTIIFDPMRHSFNGPHGVFWMFSAITLMGLFFALFFVPETKGKPLEDITDMFATRRIWQMNRPSCCKAEPRRRVAGASGRMSSSEDLLASHPA